MLDTLEKRLEGKSSIGKPKIFALTHKSGTGVRISGKRDSTKYLDIIVRSIRKDKDLVYFTLKNHKGTNKFISLPIKFKDKSMRAYWKHQKLPVYYDDYSQHHLTSKGRSFFGIQINQGQDRDDEIKIGYCLNGHPIRIGIFSALGLIPIEKDYPNLENIVRPGSGFFVITHKESTGARIYDSENNKNYIDIIVRQINKHQNVQVNLVENKNQKVLTLPISYTRIKQREYLLKRGLPIYYDNFSESEIESEDKRIRGILAIQRNQKNDEPDMIVLGYNFPNRIQKGIYNLNEGEIKFIPVRKDEFEFFKETLNLGDSNVFQHYTHI